MVLRSAGGTRLGSWLGHDCPVWSRPTAWFCVRQEVLGSDPGWDMTTFVWSRPTAWFCIFFPSSWPFNISHWVMSTLCLRVSNLYVLITYILTIRFSMRWHIILYAMRYKTEGRGSISDGVIRIFHWLTPSDRTQCLICLSHRSTCRSQSPRGQRCGSAAARLLEAWVRIPLGAWIFVCCERCVVR